MMNIERAFIVKHTHVPKYLYKYRQFTKNHLDALEKGVLWMSSAENFNDPYDAAVSFDVDRFLIEDESAEDFIASVKAQIAAVQGGGIWREKKLVRPIPQGEWRRRTTAQLIGDSYLPGKEDLARAFEEIMRRFAEDHVRRTTAWFRHGYGILSLSANCNSMLMWSHYSDAHRGFAIEYDFGALPYGHPRRRLCFPVFYTKKLRDATRYLARSATDNFNNLFGQYMCLIKKDDWAYEKEWRIIHAIGPAHANAELEMPKPSAILLGSQAKPDDEATMRNLCRTRAIPLKRMVQRTDAFDLEIEDVPV